MEDYRRLWVTWARTNYSDPQVATAAVDAVISAIESGSIPRLAAIEGHKAAINEGGEYRCRPNRIAAAIAVCALSALLFLPAIISRLSTNPSAGGYALLAVFAAAPTIGIIGLILVRKNSCFFADRATVGRRNWAGKIVARVLRSSVESISMRSGSWARVYADLGPGMQAPDDSSVMFTLRDGALMPRTRLYWWTNGRFRELAEVLGEPIKPVTS